MRIALLGFRRSFAPYYLGLFVLVALVHGLGRSQAWRHEWLWALDTVSFCTVFLGPLCAGAAAVEGVRVARARDSVLATSRGGVMVVAGGIYVWLCAVTAVAVTAVVVGAAVLVQTPRLAPVPSDLLPLPLAFAFLAFWTAAGLAVGWRLPANLTAPLTAAGSFAVIMGCHVSGVLEPLVGVGGATGSLVGLRLETGRLGAQLLMYTVAAAALVASCAWRPRARRGPVRVAVGGSILAATIGTLLVTSPEARFEHVPVQTVCASSGSGAGSGDDVEVCAAPGYAHGQAVALDAARRYRAALVSLGVPEPPRRLVQGGGTRAVGEVSLPSSAFDGAPEDVGWALVDWYLPAGCGLDRAEEAEAFQRFAAVVFAVADQEDLLGDPSFDVVGMTSAQRQGVAMAAVAVLSRCAR